MYKYMHRYKTLKAAALAVLAVLICAGMVLASGETVNVGIGVLPAGKSITITYDVIVDKNLPLADTSVEQQGVVSVSGFANVPTDDPDTGTAADPTVTYIDSIPPVAGFGKALDFDGVNQYLEVPDGGALFSTEYTIETWVRPETVRPSTLIFRTDATVSGHSNALYIDGSGRFVHYTYDTIGHSVTGTTTVETGRWYHVAGTVSSGTMRLYVNGIEEGTAVSGLGALWNGGTRYLAAYGTGALGENYLDGRMDEVRIWNTGLTGPEIQNWMYRGIDKRNLNYTALAAYYKLDEGSGVTAGDSAGSYDGVLNNMSGANWIDSTINEWYTDEDLVFSGKMDGSDEDGSTNNGLDWALTFELVTDGTKGHVVIGPDNAFSYTPNANQNGDDTFTYRVKDPALVASNIHTVAVHIAPVNDAPTITTPESVGITEDVAGAITGISFSDVDAASGPVTATLSVPSGTLTATSSGGVTAGGPGSSTLTLAGTISNINAFIAASNVTFTTALNSTSNVILTVIINDNGNTGSGGSKSASTTLTLQVMAVNDAPTITAPGSIGVTEDVAGAITGISFSDVDAASGSVTATLSVPSGTLAATSGGGVTTGGSGSSTLTLAGTISNINAFIAASNVTFTTALNSTSNVILTVMINDNGNNGGGSKSASTTVTLQVTAVNDAPVLNPITNKSVDELSVLAFTASATDPEANALTFSLDAGAPTGASIGPSSGLFTWTPTETQGPGVYSITIRVTDNGSPVADDFETVQITVKEVCSSSSITVTDAADAGDGTLRQAVLDICPGGVIDFNIPGTGDHVIILTSGELSLNKDMTITGQTNPRIVIDGNHASRVFSVAAGAIVTMDGLTIRNGSSGTLDGGGVMNSGTLTLLNSTLSGNSANSGGGIYNDSGAGNLVITNVTFSGNSATSGGGLFNWGSSPTITNVTFSGNSATDFGGGIINASGSNPLITNSIFWGDTAATGAEIHSISSTPTVTYSVMEGGCPAGSTCSNLILTDPLLGPLADNGGPTLTEALLPGSPAIDAGDDAVCSADPVNNLDQRGTVRPKGLNCDIGAYEFVPDTTTLLVSSLNPSVYGDVVTFTATVSDSEVESNPAGTVTFRDGLADIATCTGVSLSAGSAACSLSSLTGGSHTIRAEYSGDVSFSGSLSNAVSQTINRADQTITFSGPSDMPAHTAPFDISAFAGQGLVVSFDSLTLPVCTVSGNTVTLTHLAGTCTIRATQVGDANYKAATPVDRSFSVTPAALDHIVISPANATITAGGNQSYTAEGFDQYSNSRGDITGPTAFSIAPDGSCTGSSCGATISGVHIVTATNSGKTDVASLNVNPGPAVSLVLSGPAVATGGLAFDLTVTAKDSFNNTAAGYTGTVRFTGTYVQSLLPADYTFVAGDNGVRTFTGGFTLKTAGIQTVRATDTLNASITGSADITVDLFAITATVVSGNGTISCSPSSLIYGEGFNCTICPGTGYDLDRLYDNGAKRTGSCTVDGFCYAYSVAGVTADHVVKASYLNYPVIILFEGNSDCFSTVQEALDSALNDDRIQAQGIAFTENLYFNLPGVAASLEGGYDYGFSSSTGHTVITGSVTISNGKITVQDITIR